MNSNKSMIGIALIGLAATMVYLLVTGLGAEAARLLLLCMLFSFSCFVCSLWVLIRRAENLCLMQKDFRRSDQNPTA